MFKIKQYVSGSYCLSCLGCCRYNSNSSIWAPALLDEEKKLLGLERLEPVVYRQAYICCFLNPETNLCKIYNRRPWECRLYPFLLNSHNNKIYLSLDLNCPDIKDRTNTRGFRSYVNYLIQYLRRPSVVNILTKNRLVFHSYPVGAVINLAELEI